jgi:hypothetical protein
MRRQPVMVLVVVGSLAAAPSVGQAPKEERYLDPINVKINHISTDQPCSS